VHSTGRVRLLVQQLNHAGFNVQLSHVHEGMPNGISLFGPDRRLIIKMSDFQFRRLRYNKGKRKVDDAGGEVQRMRMLRSKVVSAAVAARRKGFSDGTHHKTVKFAATGGSSQPGLPWLRVFLVRLLCSCGLHGGGGSANLVQAAVEPTRCATCLACSE
jgi:hypothetical protein